MRTSEHKSHSISNAMHGGWVAENSVRRNATKIKLKFRVELKSIKKILGGLRERGRRRLRAKNDNCRMAWKLMMMNWSEPDIDTGKHVSVGATCRRRRRTLVARCKQVCWFLIQLNWTRAIAPKNSCPLGVVCSTRLCRPFSNSSYLLGTMDTVSRKFCLYCSMHLWMSNVMWLGVWTVRVGPSRWLQTSFRSF